jgi:hypothetical protein
MYSIPTKFQSVVYGTPRVYVLAGLSALVFISFISGSAIFSVIFSLLLVALYVRVIGVSIHDDVQYGKSFNVLTLSAREAESFNDNVPVPTDLDASSESSNAPEADKDPS